MQNKTGARHASGTRQAGFTLIEIMVVVVIIGLLATLILPNVLGRQDQALQVKARADIGALTTQLTLYKMDNFRYPSSSEGLPALVNSPGGVKNWQGYLDKLPDDPWGNPYQYVQPGQHNPKSFDLFSFGSDGVQGGEGTAKDIGNWEE